jgi:hypothetical protein
MTFSTVAPEVAGSIPVTHPRFFELVFHKISVREGPVTQVRREGSGTMDLVHSC